MKLAEAAKTTAMTNGRGLTAVWAAIPTANGKARAAAALFPIVAANRIVMRYTPTSRA